jgi:hypothetical protein
LDGIDIAQTHLEQVKLYKYLGSMVNGNNTVEEEIKGRISLGNKALVGLYNKYLITCSDTTLCRVLNA